MKAPLYCALVHHPVRDRSGETMTTAVTPLDVHDIARSARTYGLKGYFLVTPVEAQQRLLQRILGHWSDGGAGQRRMPERTNALGLCHLARSLQDVIDQITQLEGQAPVQVATAARATGRPMVSVSALRRALAAESTPHLLLFGTGHGLADSLLAQADCLLAPIGAGSDYNHLSVRAAAAIFFDRISGSDREDC